MIEEHHIEQALEVFGEIRDELMAIAGALAPSAAPRGSAVQRIVDEGAPHRTTPAGEGTPIPPLTDDAIDRVLGRLGDDAVQEAFARRLGVEVVTKSRVHEMLAELQSARHEPNSHQVFARRIATFRKELRS